MEGVRLSESDCLSPAHESPCSLNDLQESPELQSCFPTQFSTSASSHYLNVQIRPHHLLVKSMKKKSKNFLTRAYKRHHLNPLNLSKLFHPNLLVMHNCLHMVVTFQTHQHSKLFPDLRYLHCCSFCLKCSSPRFSIVPSFLLNTPRCRVMLPD